MRTRRSLAVVVTVGTVLAAPAAAAGSPEDRPVAVWEMNEGSGSSTMMDSSGNGLDGRIGDEVHTGTHVDDAVGYRFDRLEPNEPPARPGHLVLVPDDDLLNPGTGDYAITMRLRTTHKFGNIIQKGQATTGGGNFKMQIPNGIVECVYRGSSRSIQVSSKQRLNDGDWHTVTCARTGDEVTLTVDGSTEAHRYGWTGRIDNTWPVSIGGKSGCDQIDVGCDYYAGDLDSVVINAR